MMAAVRESLAGQVKKVSFLVTSNSITLHREIPDLSIRAIVHSLPGLLPEGSCAGTQRGLLA